MSALALAHGDPVTVTWESHSGVDIGEYVGPCSESPSYVRVRIELMGAWSDYIVKASRVKAMGSK